MFVVIRIASGDLGVACARDVTLPWRTFLTSNRGSDYMTQFTYARSQIRNLVLGTLATLTLAACGGGSDSSSAAATSTASDSVASLVSPNMGMIDRSQGVDATENTSASNTAIVSPATAVASNTSGTASSSGSATGTAGTTSGTGTVASNTKVTPPVKTTTTTGVATLDWLPPTQNSDGSVLTNLAGYTVYYGTSPSNLSQSVKVTNPGLTAYSVTNLTSGTWYFAVTSYSADGIESTRTSTVSTTI
ncbi:MAG: hypothetical protein QOI59_6889 [Gammaproteobacteria bacterium]|nr:hypothetical protein [Gammaproteobacteria bacterium]